MKVKIVITGLIFALAFFLRIYRLGEIPSGFYSDESLTGYEAYSILKTGRDQYGNLFPLAFKAFGDYRPPLDIYTTVPFISIFGLTEFATRLPSAIFSFLTCVAVFFLSRAMWHKFSIAALSSLALAISPWSLQFGRMSHGTNLATFLVVAAVYFFITGLNHNRRLLVSLSLFSLSLYAYYTTRVFVPILLVVLFYLMRDKLKKKIKHLSLGLLVALIIAIPLLMVMLDKDSGWSRVDKVSLWGDPGIVAKILEQRQDDLITHDPLARIFHNKLINGGFAFGQSFLTHFDPVFLFFQGDRVKIYQTPDMGILYLTEGLLISMAVFLLWKKPDYYRWVCLSWLVIGLLPDALTRLSPAAARIHLSLPVVSMLVGMGMMQVLTWIKHPSKKYRLLTISILALLVFQVGFFLHQNLIHVPLKYAREWHCGLRELIGQVNQRENIYDQIWVSRSGWGWINFLFYLKYPPQRIQAEIVLSEINEYGLGWVYKFSKYYFENIPAQFDFNKKILYIGTPNEFPSKVIPQKTIYYPDGSAAFILVDTQAIQTACPACGLNIN